MSKKGGVLVAVIAGIIFIVGSGFGALKTSSAQGSKMPATDDSQVAVEAIIPGNLAIDIDDASATLEDETGVSYLSFSVSRPADSRIQRLIFLVLVTDPAGNLKSAEGWHEQIDTSLQGDLFIDEPLGNPIGEGDRVRLVIEGAVEDNRLLSLASAGFTDLAKQDSGGEALLADTRLLFDDGIEISTEGYCTKKAQQAEDACANGVKEFTCDETKGTFSFKCN